MPDFNKILTKVKELWSKLDMIKRIVIGGVLASLVIVLILVDSVSSEKGKAVLYSKLTPTDFASYTKKLKDMDVSYSTSGIHTIFVDPEKKQEIIVALAQEGMIPIGVKGWELFDNVDWTETQFEKDIKLRRVVSGEIEKALNSIKTVESAKINIAWPEPELFESKVQPVTAAVLLKYAPGVERLSDKVIRGIETLVSRSVPELKADNISIAGPSGKILNDFDDESTSENRELDAVERKLGIEKKQRIEILTDIQKTLNRFYTDDRADVLRLNLQLTWNKESILENNVNPVVMKADNPDTPYSELEVKDSLSVSSKKTTEEFQGNGFTPEGPAGTEPNIPPGYKDKDYQKAKYTKTENILNNKFNESQHTKDMQPWQIKKINLSIIIDGLWEVLGEEEDEKLGWHYVRKYNSIPKEELKKMTNVLKSAVGFTRSRGDMISIEEVKKDRTKQHRAEDEELRSAKLRKKLLLGTLISILVLALALAVFQAIKREIERRRRLREEELAAQQQMMREAALRAIEEEGVEVEMSLEERARKEMLENAINLAKERPEDVANLLRTWLADD